MIDIQTFIQRNSRKILGVGILCISLIAAVGLVGQADNSVAMWSAKYSLSPGAAIKGSDLTVVNVSLGSQAPKYFSNKAKLVGSYVTKPLSQGELIPVSAISKSTTGATTREIPLGVSRSDMPLTLRVGDLVDLYSIPIKDPKAATNLVTSKIRVIAVDAQSQSMGGSINLLFSVDEKVVTGLTTEIK